MSETNETNEQPVQPTEPAPVAQPTEQAPVAQPVAVQPMAADSKSNALLMWILTIFFGFIPSLVFFLVKKEDEFVLACSKEALNMSITLLIIMISGYVLGFLLLFIPVIGMVAILIFLLLMAVGIAFLVFFIMGAVAANNNKVYRAPFAFRFIK